MHVLDGTLVPSKKQAAIMSYMLSNMAGTSLMTTEFKEGVKTPADMRSTAEWVAGYDFINLHAPQTNIENKAYAWCDIQRCERSSPLFGWPRQIIMGALHNKANNQMLASVT
eukprot:2941458-Amphidinium_carterae.1